MVSRWIVNLNRVVRLVYLEIFFKHLYCLLKEPLYSFPLAQSTYLAKAVVWGRTNRCFKTNQLISCSEYPFTGL